MARRLESASSLQREETQDEQEERPGSDGAFRGRASEKPPALAVGSRHVVDVPELPVCMTHGQTYEEAIQQGQDAVEGWIMVAKELNRPVPPPKVYIAA